MGKEINSQESDPSAGRLLYDKDSEFFPANSLDLVSVMKRLSSLILVLQMATFASAQESLIVAHRGASKDAPENTIPAFELAWRQNADAIEGDFFLTKDGEIICTHDKSTKRFNKKDLVIRDNLLVDLKQLDVGTWHSKKFAGTTMPTIAEVFGTIPKGKVIYVEVKCGPEIVPKLLSEIEKSGLQDEQIVVISFNRFVIKKLKELAPQFTANWLSSFKKEKNGTLQPTFNQALATLKSINADGFSSSKDGVTKKFIHQIQDAGYQYHVWTVDDPNDAKRLVDWGAESVTTNVPAVIRDGLAPSQ